MSHDMPDEFFTGTRTGNSARGIVSISACIIIISMEKVLHLIRGLGGHTGPNDGRVSHASPLFVCHPSCRGGS